MTGVWLEILLFFILVIEGFATRLLYSFILSVQKKVKGKLFGALTDVCAVVIGSGVMLVTCLLLADEVRVFYAVFFILGICIAHFILAQRKKRDQRSISKKS